jgi:hypothetical protein
MGKLRTFCVEAAMEWDNVPYDGADVHELAAYVDPEDRVAGYLFHEYRISTIILLNAFYQ